MLDLVPLIRRTRTVASVAEVLETSRSSYALSGPRSRTVAKSRLRGRPGCRFTRRPNRGSKRSAVGTSYFLASLAAVRICMFHLRASRGA